MTIGDFHGLNVHFITKNKVEVIASDLSDVILSELSKEGYIDEYRIENVENISLENNSIEYVFCKEAFHHFPQAYLGLYEMLRVSKKGIVFIEPLDILTKMPLLLFLKNVLDRFNPNLINKIWKKRFSWETVGNYVFKISEREVEKIAMGIGLPCIAFKKMNIIHFKEQFSNAPLGGKLLRKIKFKMGIRNFISYMRIIPYNMLTSIIFKEMPNEHVLKKLKDEGYVIIKLPENPYIKK